MTSPGPDVAGTWRDENKVRDYVERVGRLPARLAGEAELVESMPGSVRRLLDLGCGDGRLTACVLAGHPEVEHALVVDVSPPMLRAARERFRGDDRVEVREHDLNDAVTALGRFDAVVSGFAIHHLAHERKRALFREVHELLEPGGVFANLEVVQCATDALQADFYRRIGRDGGDPEDVLAPVEPLLEWMREAGFRDVECQWRWRGFALLCGRR